MQTVCITRALWLTIDGSFVAHFTRVKRAVSTGKTEEGLRRGIEIQKNGIVDQTESIQTLLTFFAVECGGATCTETIATTQSITALTIGRARRNALPVFTLARGAVSVTRTFVHSCSAANTGTGRYSIAELIIQLAEAVSSTTALIPVTSINGKSNRYR